MRQRSRVLEGVPLSAQKALQGSQTKTRKYMGGTKENNILPIEGVIDLPSRQINKSQQEVNRKIVLLARTVSTDKVSFT